MFLADKILRDTDYGRTVELAFIRSAEKKGCIWEWSSEYDNIYNHIDVWVGCVVNNKCRMRGIDVKGGNHPHVVWIEFSNVNGESGWLYGMADYIAFDMPELLGFVIVPRLNLVSYVESKIEKVFVDKQNATYKLYQRAGRKDIISRFTLDDLKKVVGYRLWLY